MAASFPPQFKVVQHYLKAAIEHDKRDPVIAYYCRLYAIQKAMEIDRKSPEAKAFIGAIMDQLEKAKTELHDRDEIKNDIVGQAYLENYALKLFLHADNSDRAGKFDKNVVKTFYTAGVLCDALLCFGPLTEEAEKTRRYAKWKAAYIHNCLKNGETPVPGPSGEGGEEFLEDFATPGGAMGGAAGMQQPGPADPWAGGQPSSSSAPPQQPSPSLPIVPPTGGGATASSTGATSTSYSSWQPPSTGIELGPEDYQKAIKMCKHATSALQYEDSPTAIDNLRKALHLLTTGQSS